MRKNHRAQCRCILLFGGILLAAVLACSRGDNQSFPTITALPTNPYLVLPTVTKTFVPSPTLAAPLVTPGATSIAARPSPTPDPFRELPPLRDWVERHVVRAGETLNRIAVKHGVAVEQIQYANGLSDPNVLSVGQELIIPPPTPEATGPDMKILPDSELVYGPSTIRLPSIWDLIPLDSPLHEYWGQFDGEMIDGPRTVQIIAENYSINPKLLLAILEFQSGAVRGGSEFDEWTAYPIGWAQPGKEGLASQLSWAADQLNAGFYRWRSGWPGPLIFSDGRVGPLGLGVNAGTVAVQYLFSQLYSADQWRRVVSWDGFPKTYVDLFGDPFLLSVEPLVPEDLSQPPLRLPFEDGVAWSFTGAPHSAFGNWAAWAALDFAPSSNSPGCSRSDEWIVAAADGRVVRSERGQVVQDMDGDGFDQTGWALLYLHIETRDRIPNGTFLRAGDRLGHPSCEGGISTGTHVHLARKYNGVWIEADGVVPFDLEGWVPKSSGSSYNGYLIFGETTLKACACRADYNQIRR